MDDKTNALMQEALTAVFSSLPREMLNDLLAPGRISDLETGDEEHFWEIVDLFNQPDNKNPSAIILREAIRRFKR
ncbi:hypothetical protein [Caudoviricetes sp.]|nr:hypothetical protein [Caudoviricetes sp.]